MSPDVAESRIVVMLGKQKRTRLLPESPILGQMRQMVDVTRGRRYTDIQMNKDTDR